MSVEPIGLIVVLIGLGCFWAGPIFGIYALLVTSLLQSSAALTLPALGGASIQPAHLLLMFFFAEMARHDWILDGMLSPARPPRAGFWLTILLVYGLIAAIVLPRLFAGATYTFGIGRDGSDGGVKLVSLAPNSGNLTQTFYFAGDCVCFLLVASFARRPRNMHAIGAAVLFCACANLVFALIDVLTGLTNTAEILAPIRNANYNMLNEAKIMGMKRIVGSFPEASAFAFASLGLFGFCFSLWLRHYRTRSTGILSALIFVSLIASTATTAYAGLIVYLAIIYAANLLRLLRRTATYNMSLFVFVAPPVAAFVVFGLAFSDGAWLAATETLDNLLFNKMSTASGIERAMWNQQAMQNFVDTYGLGAGIGSVKSSSLITSLLANVGVFGLSTFALFVGIMLYDAAYGERDPELASLRQAASSACLAYVATASISGGSINPGLVFFVLAGLACGRVVPVAATAAAFRRVVMVDPATGLRQGSAL